MAIQPISDVGVDSARDINRRKFLQATGLSVGVVGGMAGKGTAMRNSRSADDKYDTREISYGEHDSIILTENYPVHDYFDERDTYYISYELTMDEGDKTTVTLKSLDQYNDEDSVIYIALEKPTDENPSVETFVKGINSSKSFDLTAAVSGDYRFDILAVESQLWATAHLEIGENQADDGGGGGGEFDPREINYGEQDSLIITEDDPVHDYFEDDESNPPHYISYELTMDEGDKTTVTLESLGQHNDDGTVVYLALETPTDENPSLETTVIGMNESDSITVTANVDGNYRFDILSIKSQLWTTARLKIGENQGDDGGDGGDDFEPRDIDYGEVDSVIITENYPVHDYFSDDDAQAHYAAYALAMEEGDKTTITLEALDRYNDNNSVVYIALKKPNDDNPTLEGLVRGTSGQDTTDVTASVAGDYWIGVLAPKSQLSATARLEIGENQAESENERPTASFTVTPSGPHEVGDDVTLDASDSFDPDGQIVQYEWQFEEGGEFQALGESFTAEVVPPVGESEVTLRVTDDDGATDTETKTFVTERAGPRFSFSINGGTAVQGESVPVEISVENTGAEAIESSERFYIYFNIADAEPLPPGWEPTVTEKENGIVSGVVWAEWSLAPGETDSVVIEIDTPSDVEPGEYAVAGFGSSEEMEERIEETGMITIERPKGAWVTDADGNPVARPEYKIVLRGDYGDSEFETSRAKIVDEGVGGDDGYIPLPRLESYSEEDEQMLAIARKGDWFTVSHRSLSDLDRYEDYYGFELVLNKQLIFGPTVARVGDSPVGDPYGVVSVWRTNIIPEEGRSRFTVEVTNTNTQADKEIWNITHVTALQGLAAGTFYFTTPSYMDINRNETKVRATHPTYTFGNLRTVPEPPVYFFHPENDHLDLPLYTTTLFLRGMQLIASELPTKDPGWHELTPERTQEVEEFEQKIQNRAGPLLLDGPVLGEACSGCFSPLEISDRLEQILWLLDGDRTIAPVGRGVNNRYHPDEFTDERTAEYEEWKEDLPFSYADSWEASVVAEFEVDTNQASQTQQGNELPRYSLEAEWLRARNNRGIFTTTFTTGPIDVTTGGEVDATNTTSPSIDAQIRNRSLEPVTITEVELEGTVLQEDTITHSLSNELEPGEYFIFNKIVDIDSGTRTNWPVAITVKDAEGNTTTTSTVIRVTESNQSTLSQQDPDDSSQTEQTEIVKQEQVETEDGTAQVRVRPAESTTYKDGEEISVGAVINGDINDMTVTYKGEQYSVEDGTTQIPIEGAGEQQVTITADERTTTVPITVEENTTQETPTPTAETTPTQTPTESSTDQSPTATEADPSQQDQDSEATDAEATVSTDDGSGPGFGIASALTGIGGLLYMLRNAGTDNLQQENIEEE